MQKVPKISRFFLCILQKSTHPHTYSIRPFYTQIKKTVERINHDRKRITEKYVVYNPDQTAAIACSKAGISPTADYYAGAVQTVQQACARKKTNAYQISLCNHLHQLEQDTQPYDKQPEKKLLRDGIRTVQPYRRFYTPLQKLHRLQVRACSRCFVSGSLLRKNYTEIRSVKLSVPPAGIRSPKKLWF